MLKHIIAATFVMTAALAPGLAEAKSKRGPRAHRHHHHDSGRDVAATFGAAVIGGIVGAAVHQGATNTTPVTQVNLSTDDSERFHDGISYAMALEGGIVKGLGEPDLDLGKSATLRLSRREPIIELLGVNTSVLLRLDQFGEQTHFLPGGSIGLGIFTDATDNTSVSVDVVAAGFVGPAWEGESIHAAAQLGLEFGFWLTPKFANHDFGMGLIVRGAVGTDTTRGLNFEPSIALAFSL